MKADRYLSLCDPHNSIIHQFGFDTSCTKTAGICIRGCSQHDHISKNNKHQFMNSRQFYRIVEQLRQKYTSFKMNFKQVYIKKYISIIYDLLDCFEDYLENQYLQKTSLIEIFCKYSNQKQLLQQVIQQKLSQIQFSELQCNQIYQIIRFQKVLQKQTKEDEQKRMIKLISKVFEHYLITNKVINNDKNILKNKNQTFQQLNLTDLFKELETKLKNYQLARSQYKIKNLVIKIKQDQNFQLNISSQQFCTKIADKLKMYIQRTQAQNLQISANFQVVFNMFWQKLFSNLTALTNLKSFVVKCESLDTNKCYKFQQQIEKQFSLPFKFKVQQTVQTSQLQNRQTRQKT